MDSSMDRPNSREMYVCAENHTFDFEKKITKKKRENKIEQMDAWLNGG